MSRARAAWRAAALAVVMLATIAGDRATKRLAVAHLRDAPARSYLSDTVRLVYAENAGAFLSLGASWPEWLRRAVFGFGVAAALVAVAVSARRHHWDGAAALGVGLMWAGGLSNLIDRVVRGRVIDFVILRAGPLHTGVFNVADAAITLGLVLVLSQRAWASRSRQRYQQATER